MSLSLFMETRTSSSFVLSTAALVVAIATLMTRPDGAPSAPSNATASVAPNPSTATVIAQPPQPVTPAQSPQAATPPSPLRSAADAVVAITNAQTERVKAEAGVKTEQFKADTQRKKDELEHKRLEMAAWCDCLYKIALLIAATLLVLLALPRLTSLTFFGVIMALSPREAPPLPKDVDVLDSSEASETGLYVSHTVARSTYRRRPRFIIQIEGQDESVGGIRDVTYHLHPAYGQTVHTIKSAPFTLDIPAIGEFLLYADVKLTNGRAVRLQRYLDA